MERVSMADKTFDSRIKVRYNYSNGKAGNTAYRPYAFDNGDGGQYSFSDYFANNIPIYHSDYNQDDGDGYFFGSYAEIKSLEEIGSKVPKPFLCFRSTNGTNSLFASIDKEVLSRAGVNANRNVKKLGRYAGSSVLLFNRHGIIPDKGTLKFKSGKSDTVYTAEGLRSVDKSYNNVDAVTFFAPYGSVITGKDDFTNTSDTTQLYVNDVYANDGYSNMMLVVFGNYGINNGIDYITFPVYSFVPISFYELSILNNKAPSSKWSIKISNISPTDSYNKGTISIICGSTSSGLDVNILGRNYYNLSRGLLKPEANNIFDFNWRAPNAEGGTEGSLVSLNEMNRIMSYGTPVRYSNIYSVYTYFISEMSYKYYMYGEGRSLWVENANKSVDVNNLNTVEDKIKADFRVKWYPYATTKAKNPDYFKDKDYVL